MHRLSQTSLVTSLFSRLVATILISIYDYLTRATAVFDQIIGATKAAANFNDPGHPERSPSGEETRAGANAHCAGADASRNCRRNILPRLVLGSGSVRNSMILGTL